MSAAESDVDGLDAAVGRAIYAGAEGVLLSQARSRLQELKEAKHKKDQADAEAQLSATVAVFKSAGKNDSKAAADLRGAIAFAVRVGDDSLVTKANEAKQQLEAAQEVQVSQARAAAQRSLASAIEWGGVEAIDAAIKRAKLNAADNTAVAEAEHRIAQLRDMEDRKSMQASAEALESAIRGKDAAELRRAVAQAMRAGVSMEALWRGQRRMAELQDASQENFLRDVATAAIQKAQGVGENRSFYLLFIAVRISAPMLQ